MILIGLGGNLPAADGRTALAIGHAAGEALRGLPGLRLAGLSRWYASRPVPEADQPDYVNAVAWLEGRAEPARLLGWLHRIEQAGGRRRSVANAARTLDLDIIDMDGLVRTTPDPILPHPRAHLRAFVLRPIADLLPGWRHPVLGQTAAGLLAGLPPARLSVL